VTISANRKPVRYGHYVIGVILVILFTLSYCAPPRAVIYYSKDGREELNYILNIQHRTDKGTLAPGETTGNTGHIFPDKNFFMELYWWSDKGRNHCVNITPKWPNTKIYLDANGDIDYSEGSGTDSDRLKQCITDTASP
jgi:hypothetical protein